MGASGDMLRRTGKGQTSTMQDEHHTAEEMEAREILEVELRVLQREHRSLDDEITALQDGPAADALMMQRLKRRKLCLKDQIARIEDRLFPDIIA